MKNISLAALLLIALAGCANDKIVQKGELWHMSRAEVSSAIGECESAGQRAVVVYARAEWQDRLVPVPVDVQCAPSYQRTPGKPA